MLTMISWVMTLYRFWRYEGQSRGEQVPVYPWHAPTLRRSHILSPWESLWLLPFAEDPTVLPTRARLGGQSTIDDIIS